MTSQNQPVPQLQEESWICDLAFLSDLTGHLNDLNTSLQGKGLLITGMYYRIKAFKMALNLWMNQLQAGNTAHFPKLSQVPAPDLTLSEEYVKILEALRNQFDSRFENVEILSTMFQLLKNRFQWMLTMFLPGFKWNC